MEYLLVYLNYSNNRLRVTNFIDSNIYLIIQYSFDNLLLVYLITFFNLLLNLFILKFENHFSNVINNSIYQGLGKIIGLSS